MGVADLVDAQVAGPAVGDHRGAGGDVVGDELVQCGGGSVVDNLQAAATEALGLFLLDSDCYQRFLALGAATSQACLRATDIGFIDLHATGEQFPVRPDQHGTQPVQHRPSRRIRADLKGALQAQRRDTILSGGELPTRLEPHRQRCPAPIEQGARSHGSLLLTPGALEAAISDAPASGAATVWANETILPADPFPKIQAVRVRREPRLELTQRARIVHSTPRPTHHHAPNIVGSNE